MHTWREISDLISGLREVVLRKIHELSPGGYGRLRGYESLLERTIMCKGPEVGRNQRRLICVECIERWREHGKRLEMRHRKG